MTEITYTRSGDYEIPDITLSDSGEAIGRWGRMRRTYLREQRPILYNNLLLSETLYPHLRESEAAAQARMETITAQMKARRGIDEAMKASDPMGWTGEMNNIRAAAEEVILTELIYQ